MTETSIQEARRLVMIAVRELPQLTTFGIGVHYAYHRQGKDAVAAEISKQQDEIDELKRTIEQLDQPK